MPRRKSESLLPALNEEELNYYLPKIEELLRTTSKEFPLKAWEIVEKVGLERPRMMKIINKLRRELTLPICSGNYGYYVTDNPEDLIIVAKSLERRRNVIKLAEDGILQMAKDMQYEIDLKNLKSYLNQGIQIEDLEIPNSIQKLNGKYT